jgi:dienelactone hydrolase
MSKRLVKFRDSLNAQLRFLKPSLSFNGKSYVDWMVWKREFLACIRHNIGRFPKRVPLKPEVVERMDCGKYFREKVIFDSEKYSSVPAYVLVPKDVSKNKRRPGILCAHGHGRGKVDVVGIAASKEEYGKNIAPFNYDYGRQFAERGYVVIAPDWRCFGERAPDSEWVRAPTRDPCNVVYLAYGYFGYNLLALQIWDGMRTIDYLQSRQEVDPKRIGCVGLSFGGTMTTYLAALDKRVKVAVISGYMSTIKDALGDRGKANTCGSQYSPGLLLYGDIADVAGLAAPKPLLVEIGKNDTCFVVEDAKEAYKHLRKIYSASGHPERLGVDIFDGGHEFSGRKAFDWFSQWL